MKSTLSLVLLVSFWSSCLNAQFASPVALDSTEAPTAVEVGPHHRVVQTVKVGVDQRGQQVTTTNSYVAIGTGMNVFSETEGKWVPASDQIELVNGGAIAARTQAKVFFLPNLNDSQPPIDLYLPDGR